MQRSKIMIVDDEEHIRLLYSEELTDEGYDVLTHDSGYQLLEIIESEKPNLLVLDIKMPEHNGLELLQKIRSKYYDLPVIICTAYDAFKYDMRTIHADHYVIKSLDLTGLKVKIATALGYSASRESSNGPVSAGHDIDITRITRYINDQFNSQIKLIILNITKGEHTVWLTEQTSELLELISTLQESPILSKETISLLFNSIYEQLCSEIVISSKLILKLVTSDHYNFSKGKKRKSYKALSSKERKEVDNLLQGIFVECRPRIIAFDNFKNLIIDISQLEKLASSPPFSAGDGN